MHARSDAHAHPATAPPQAQPAGVGSQTSRQPRGPLLRSAQAAQCVALAPASWGRAQRSEAMARVDVRAPGSLQDAPRSAAGGVACVPKDTQASWSSLLRLFERRAQRKASSAAHPAREHRRLPVAERRDAACRVAFSLVTFFWRSKRKLLARRATPGLRPQHKHAFQISTPRLRQAQPEREQK